MNENLQNEGQLTPIPVLQEPKISYFGVDFGLAILGTVVAMAVLGFLDFYRSYSLVAWLLTFLPSALTFIYRWFKNRIVSWGAIAIGFGCLFFMNFISGLGGLR